MISCPRLHRHRESLYNATRPRLRRGGSLMQSSRWFFAVSTENTAIFTEKIAIWFMFTESVCYIKWEFIYVHWKYLLHFYRILAVLASYDRLKKRVGWELRRAGDALGVVGWELRRAGDALGVVGAVCRMNQPEKAPDQAKTKSEKIDTVTWKF